MTFDPGQGEGAVVSRGREVLSRGRVCPGEGGVVSRGREVLSRGEGGAVSSGEGGRCCPGGGGRPLMLHTSPSPL